MSVPSDTSPEAQRVLDAIHREMSAGRKWAIVEDLHQFGRELHAAGLLSRDDGVTRAQIRDDWIARHYGTIPYDRGAQRMSATGRSARRSTALPKFSIVSASITPSAARWPVRFMA